MKQRITRLIDDEGAVSPVIGVILMVAITVILAAVIGTFVLGLGGQVSQTAPQASLSVTNVDASGTTDTITFKHGGSDTIKASETAVKANKDGGNQISLSSPDEGDFGTADTITLQTSGTPDITGWAGGGWNLDSGTAFTFQSGDTITVTFIDQPSGQIIADKTINA